MLNEGFLLRCYGELKDKAAGVDGETLESYGIGIEDKLAQLVKRMKEKKYTPQQILKERNPNLSPTIAQLPPVFLDELVYAKSPQVGYDVGKGF